MPTLIRLLTILALIAGAIYAAMLALVMFVEPVQVPVTVDVPMPQAESSTAEAVAPARQPPVAQP